MPAREDRVPATGDLARDMDFKRRALGDCHLLSPQINTYMPEYDNTNRGTLFVNDRKEKENQPDGKGSALIGGVEYWVSSWTAQDKNGNPYRKLAFTAKDAQPTQQRAPEPAYRKPSQDAVRARQAPPRTNSGGFEDMDSDVPF